MSVLKITNDNFNEEVLNSDQATELLEMKESSNDKVNEYIKKLAEPK